MRDVRFVILASLLLALTLLTALPILAPDRLSPRYEYKIETFKDAELTSDLARLGRGGWELVFARRALAGEGDGRDGAYEAIFKRPL